MTVSCETHAWPTAIAAYSARETFRLPVSDLGKADATPMAKQDYDRLRSASFGGAATA